MIWNKYPVVLVLGVILVSSSGSTWFSGNGDAQQFSKPHLLFPSIGKVVDIPDGSMERFSDVLQRNEISAVFFYAPWCGQSSVAAQEFTRASKMLYKEISFIAINCWIGSCFSQKRVDQFPKVVVIHSHFNGIEYKGPYKTSKMIVFLWSIIRPFIYLGTDAALNTAKQSNEELIISYFNQPRRSNTNYTTFFNLALQFRAKESSPTFSVITSAKLALKAGVSSVSGVAYHRLNHDVLNYPSSKNFTTENLTSWIDANRYKLVVQLTLRSHRRRHFVDQLSKGPALILFLPIKLHVSEEKQQLLDTYVSTASQYFNCSCTWTSNEMRTNSQTLPDSTRNRDDTTETLKQINVKEQTLDALQSAIRREDVLIPGRVWSLPLLNAHKSVCQSLQIPQQSSVKNRRNVCDVCYTCQRQNCQRNMGPGLQSFLSSDIAATLSSLRNGCISFRAGYFLFATTSICCSLQTVDTTENLSSLEQYKTLYQQTVRQMRRTLNEMFSDLMAAIIPPVTKTDFQNGDSQARSVDGKTSPQQGLPLKEYYDPLRMSYDDETKSNSCTAADDVTQFTGAGCHRNRSVNFFLMDSTEYWSVAEKLGVRNTPKDRTALVIADLEADAQYVLDEDLYITKALIVEFVMAYMKGNLSRRFRSNSARPYECVSSQACVVEVVTSNFHDVVLDETKDVLLLYYASWCAYYQALGPVLLTVAKFFQNITDITIARINADENDLPWEFYVPLYPSFIFFPAYRKDFSVRFPDSMERTAANIIQFILDHGVKASKVFEEFRLSEKVTDQLDELEIFLGQVEEENEIIALKLKEAVRVKELWQNTSAGSSQRARTDFAAQERPEHLNINLKQQQHQIKEKVLMLIERGTDVSKELKGSEEKLNHNEKLLIQLLFESRSFVFKSEQLSARVRRTQMSLQEQKKIVLELQKSLLAIRRRTTQLEISNSILRTKLKNLSSKGR